MSLVETQRSIEHVYDKSRVSRMIIKDIQNTPDLIRRIIKCKEMLESVYLMGPHFNQKNQYLSTVSADNLEEHIINVLIVLMPNPKGFSFSALVGQCANASTMTGVLDRFKIVSSVISYMYFAGLVHLTRPGDSDTGMMEITPVYICDSKIMAFIKQSRYLPPMVCAPAPLLANNSSGYLHKTFDSLILKGYNHHNGDICLDSLNTFNQVAYSLDIKMLTTFDEEPKQLLDTHQKELQFNKLREDSYEIFKLLITNGNNFHFTHKVDKRGRTYCQGYHVSTQGNSFRKAILNLAKKEIVNGDFK